MQASAYMPRIIAALAAVAFALVVIPTAQAAWQFPRVPEPAAGYVVHRDAEPSCYPSSCTDLTSREIWLAGSGLHSYEAAHELGHLYLEGLDNRWKGAIMVTLGYDPLTQPWFAGTGFSCYPYTHKACPSENAADAYAAVAMGFSVAHDFHNWESAYNYYPTRRQYRRFKSVLRRSA